MVHFFLFNCYIDTETFSGERNGLLILSFDLYGKVVSNTGGLHLSTVQGEVLITTAWLQQQPKGQVFHPLPKLTLIFPSRAEMISPIILTKSSYL